MITYHRPRLFSAEVCRALADLMDDNSDTDGQWDGGDVCEALAGVIARGGGWAECPATATDAGHGSYSANKTECPFDHDLVPDDDDEDDGWTRPGEYGNSESHY